MRVLAVLFCVFFIQVSAQAALKITTYNIRMFDSKKSPTNKKELTKVLKSLKFDLLTVEEIVNGNSFEALIKKVFPGYKTILTKCGGAGRQKIGFVYNPVKVKLLQSHEDKRISDPDVIVGEFGCGTLRPALIGMFQEVKTRKKFVTIGVHLKAGGSQGSYTKRAKQYKILEQMIGELKRANHNNIIVTGDFNTTGYDDNDLDYVKFNDMLSASRTSTLSEKLDCTAYWSGENRTDRREESSILDHVIHTNRFLGYKKTSVKVATHCAKVKCSDTPGKADLGIHYKEVSDHCPVIATFK
jgi:endonuclease/exonuclease/phosphatase family metal-dependent hydrolase